MDEEGQALRNTFMEVLTKQGVAMAPELEGTPPAELMDRHAPAVSAAAEATTMSECKAFMEILLGPSTVIEDACWLQFGLGGQ